MKHDLTLSIHGKSTVSIKADTRYSFTFQFLKAADFFNRESKKLEELPSEGITQEVKTHHRAYVVGSVMQSIAALEAEAHEITHHGPGNHMGSSAINTNGAKLLEPLAKMIDTQSVLARFDAILHLLGKPPINHGVSTYENIALAIKLRHELIHYKSLQGQEIEQSKFFKRLQVLKIPPSPFSSASSNFFPHQILSSACGHWVLRSTANYLKEVYSNLGYPDYLERFNFKQSTSASLQS